MTPAQVITEVKDGRIAHGTTVERGERKGEGGIREIGRPVIYVIGSERRDNGADKLAGSHWLDHDRPQADLKGRTFPVAQTRSLICEE